jgi:uncharacterized membrane protein
LATERTGLNDKTANVIAKTVGSMWMFYGSIIGFAVWMAGLRVIVAGDHYPFALMLLAVGGIMQWLAMIAIIVSQNAQGDVQDKQVEHLHRLGVTTHRLVVENTALTQEIHDHFIKKAPKKYMNDFDRSVDTVLTGILPRDIQACLDRTQKGESPVPQQHAAKGIRTPDLLDSAVKVAPLP